MAGVKSRWPFPSGKRGGKTTELMGTWQAAWKPSPAQQGLQKVPTDSWGMSHKEDPLLTPPNQVLLSITPREDAKPHLDTKTLQSTQMMIIFNHLFELHLKNHLQNLKGKIPLSLQNQ